MQRITYSNNVPLRLLCNVVFSINLIWGDLPTNAFYNSINADGWGHKDEKVQPCFIYTLDW